ncbi:PAAR-like domain-containing protein [Massilia pseudoviolaceinigra]|uniref:PAAR-like domain-containing protein n=1 Tax=Massilia pseudoviolaceinigra TaxID=3057165 RepID=UPI00279653FF|nr:PAAR-like domain-containing protein [Massilia sp. CCM 9206]MDQ1918741.1 DUF4150 domain-containing protein [Massilia sp. CCM 9206]
MQTHVYANDQEIACKAAGDDGISPQAFPDPCWSPPGPPGGPLLIPYPNTCFASSITNGTSTIFICGKESAIEDESYFATSTGNEQATQAFGKGFKTAVITGRAYFTQWSFDVLFEGFGVPRHTDMVSHNHGSMPSNTALFPYISRGWFSHECSDEEKRIKRACKPEKKDSKAKKDIKKKSKFLELLQFKRKNKAKDSKKPWHWTDDHCDGLEMALPDGTKGKEYVEELSEAFKKLPGELDILRALKSELQEMAVNAAGKAGMKWLARAGVKQVGGSAVPVAGNIVMGGISLIDAGYTAYQVNEMRTVAKEALSKLNILESKIDKIKQMQVDLKDLENLGTTEEKIKKAQALGSDGQDIIASLNDCTMARKCNLVPYGTGAMGNTFKLPPKETAPAGTKPSFRRDTSKPSNVEPANAGGCCPGQTGHHLVPGGSLKEACKGAYDHDAAPTVCVEGTSQYFGSHQRAHGALANQHNLLAQIGRGNGDKRPKKIADDGTMSMDDALDSATRSHQEAFPLSGCSPKCIRAQLESYYKLCKNGRPTMVNANSRTTVPAEEVGFD